ncbi:GH1 family beta-glucosidase [Streptomyces sp. NPDC052071]|uniref:GH1 family beta-glucosidase n=1 Tax=Streptomyces TaxID=1883 RepID=UPI0023F674C3|nr:MULTISPECIES: GH1 family beta-glucosidase [Streptomyces]MDF6064863.1 beta-glucosidase [Streptomyces sp. JH010]WJY33775.1 GH1 family beta-glucosidase [Streptomyces sp. P9-2B-1]WSI17328.1 GH1 family beta-glucosidase [[Kitasatospora] papulosa]
MNLVTPRSSLQPVAVQGLPAGFRWGVATSSYQIEGAASEDGRTPSIWDTFCRVPGAVHHAEHGDVACDHYHRMPEDVELIAGLGVDTYRFSLAWPRIQPGGRGPANAKGLDFYKRLVDELQGRGVTPWVTLYHWDLPQELEDAGGWPARDTALRFAEYAMLAYEALGDRVEHWTTLNEPWCSAMLGYAYGAHAPGRTDMGDAMGAVHHLLLGHGLAARQMREAAGSDPLELGITLNLGTATPETGSDADREACRRADGMGTRLYLDPLVHGRYPEDVVEDLAAQGIELPVREGDLAAIATPLDVLGVNFYRGALFSGVTEDGSPTDADGLPVVRGVERDLPRTAMDWEITPTELTDLLLRLQRDYALPTVITENGAAFDDTVAADGSVPDSDRTAYLADHIEAVAEARRQGADVRGYFAWSLMDNFEWAYGYDKRFGIVRVDYDTQLRTLKDSAKWYRDTIQLTRNARTD